MSSFSEERARHVSRIEALQTELAEGARKEAEYRARLEKSLAQVRSLSSQLEVSESQRRELGAKISSLERDNQALQQLRLENEGIIKVLEEGIKVSDRIDEDAKTRVSKLEAQVVELADLCSRKNAEINQLSESHKELQERLESLIVQKDHAEDELLHVSQMLMNERRERESLRLRLEASDAKLVELEVPKVYPISSPAFSEDFGPVSPPLSPPSSTRVRRSAGKELGGTFDSLPSLRETDSALLEENEALKAIIKQVFRTAFI